MNKDNIMIKSILLLVATLLISSPALADWTLDAGNSNLSYGTIKNDAIGESNTFKTVSGTIDENGHIKIDIALASVDTQLELRDERMRDIVFKVAENANAKLTGNMDMQQFATLAVGSNRVIETSIMLELVGEKVEIDATLVVIRLAENKVMVIPHNVIFIDVDDFELAPAIETLRGLAGLDTIATVVPMSFYLTFTK